MQLNSEPSIKPNGRNTFLEEESTITMCVNLLKYTVLSLTFYRLQTETKDSKWDMPDELLLLLEKVEKESQSSAS